MSVAPPSAAGDLAVSARPARRARCARRAAIAVAAVAAVAGAAVVIADPFADPGRRSGNARPGNGAPTALATVTRGRLAARTQVDGRLGFAGRYEVINQARGTYTKLPRAGRVVRQGEVLYRVGDRPVILLAGSAVPAYRALKKGMSGRDVRQLNAALAALGHPAPAGSDDFTAATAYALKALQERLDAPRTGRLDLGQAVFLPRGAVRVTAVKATRGGPAAPGTAALAATSTARQVSVSLDAAQRSAVKVGDRVTLTLPDGRTTPGEVTWTGAVAKSSQSGSPTVPARITPSDASATGGLDQAPVRVSIVTDSVKDALAVPVNALLALAGGGYAVEAVPPGGGRRLIPVSLGLFDDAAGTVEVKGAGLAAGLRVVVPAS